MIWLRRLSISAVCLFSPVAAFANPIACGQEPQYGGATTCVVGVPVSDLELVPEQQYLSEWCWATAISMIFKYYGFSISEQDVVKQAYGSIVNMPGQPWQITQSLNRTWTDDNGQSFQSTAQIFDPSTGQSQVDINTVVDALVNNKPVIFGSNGHAMLLTAIKFFLGPNNTIGPIVYARIIDPATGGARALDQQHSVFTYVAIAEATPTTSGNSMSSGSAPISSKSFCDVVNDFTAAIPSGLSGLDSGQFHKTTEVPPGAKDCRVHADRQSISCDFLFQDNQSAGAEFSNLSQQLSACFPANASTDASTNTLQETDIDDGKISLDLHRYTNNSLTNLLIRPSN